MLHIIDSLMLKGNMEGVLILTEEEEEGNMELFSP